MNRRPWGWALVGLLLATLTTACEDLFGGNPSSPSDGGGAGSVTLSLSLDVIQGGAGGSSAVSAFTAEPAVQTRQWRARGTITAANGDATVSIACQRIFDTATPVPTGLADGFPVTPGVPVVFEFTVDADLPVPAAGTLRCTVSGTDTTGAAVDAMAETPIGDDNGTAVVDSCDADGETLCAYGRFRITVAWSNGTDVGTGRVIAGQTLDSGGWFNFFLNPSEQHLFVQVLNNCATNSHFWVFAQATTDVEVTLRVSDTQAGVTRTYTSPLGEATPEITDTSAFATCP